eukprot:2184812-Rhodomonas_salina.1
MLSYTSARVRGCDSCQKMKLSHRLKLGTPQLPDVPAEPWEKILVDFCGPLPTTKCGHDNVA